MPSLEKALIVNAVTQEKFFVQFNPEEYTLNKDVNYAQVGIPGLNSPVLQFVHGGLQTLEMELLMDTYEVHSVGGRTLNQAGDDVRKLVQKLALLMEVDNSTHAPPPAVFSWGNLTFSCVLARMSQKYILFLPDGTPVRARLQVTFNEYKPADLDSKETKRETSDYSRFHVVHQGETLSQIAHQVYGNPKLWRPIAILNRIDHPRRLLAGQTLLIPQLPYRDPENGEVYTQ
jgi:hypothetical protein